MATAIDSTIHMLLVHSRVSRRFAVQLCSLAEDFFSTSSYTCR